MTERLQRRRRDVVGQPAARPYTRESDPVHVGHEQRERELYGNVRTEKEADKVEAQARNLPSWIQELHAPIDEVSLIEERNNVEAIVVPVFVGEGFADERNALYKALIRFRPHADVIMASSSAPGSLMVLPRTEASQPYIVMPVLKLPESGATITRMSPEILPMYKSLLRLYQWIVEEKIRSVALPDVIAEPLSEMWCTVTDELFVPIVGVQLYICRRDPGETSPSSSSLEEVSAAIVIE